MLYVKYLRDMRSTYVLNCICHVPRIYNRSTETLYTWLILSIQPGVPLDVRYRTSY